MAGETRCPYCGHEYKFPWDLFPNDDHDAQSSCFREAWCENCRRRFEIERSVEIEYKVHGVVDIDEHLKEQNG
jgi:hypothetical protein